MRRKFGRLLAFGLIICLLAAYGPAFAESMHTEVENPSLEAEVLLGYDGRITYGKIIPVRVTVRNHGEDLEGILAVNGYVNPVKYDRFESEIFVPAGGERTVVLPVTIKSKQDTFTAEILQGGEVILAVNAKSENVINPSAMMIGVLSSRPRNLANLDITQENDTLYRYEYWQTVALTPETLPEDRKLLDSFAMIVLDDTDPASLTEKQKQALCEWVKNGRVLVVFKDSYAHCMIPFLTAHFSRITVLDMRYIKDGVSNHVNVDDYDSVLFVYNAITFSQDRDIRGISIG